MTIKYCQAVPDVIKVHIETELHVLQQQGGCTRISLESKIHLYQSMVYVENTDNNTRNIHAKTLQSEHDFIFDYEYHKHLHYNLTFNKKYRCQE